ncbi:X protein [Orthohepadnavirus bassarisci]|uniref:X protein n=1 Tax=Ringtail hepadnavirus TaxID=2881033 RepID=A0A8K1ICQ4_9HEPA|nr:X protein [Ringtail hepadnavirus]UBZ53992.1 X protein [Ringtail hepadnavirus]UBZ53999.1 X protein [Ringtail hepadnavirus]
MAARVHCQLDSSGHVLLLRPLRTEPGRRPLSRPSGFPPLSTAAAVSPVHGENLAVRRLPACAFSDAGPCALRFTCADLGCMETTMNLVPWLTTRTMGLRSTTVLLTKQINDQLWEEWEERGWSQRLCTYVIGGCGHKLL